MKSVVVTQYGGPEVLELREVPKPEPGPGQALIRVQAAGVNYADIMQRMGVYPNGPEPPFGAGFEVAGAIEAIGPGVTGWEPDDGVMAFCQSGYSEYVVAEAAQLLQKPHKLDYLRAAALPCQYLTAYHALLTLSRLEPEQTVLIQAAAGGLGSMLVQIAALRGARVIGTCGTADKCMLVSQMGAQHAINYQEEDFHERVMAITEGRGCDLVIESVGGDVFTKSLLCVKPRGRLVTLGVASGKAKSIKSLYLLFNNITVSGFHLFAYLDDEEAMRGAMADLTEWLAGKLLTIYTNHTFSLKNAAEAHRQIEARQTYGKVLLDLTW